MKGRLSLAADAQDPYHPIDGKLMTTIQRMLPVVEVMSVRGGRM